jgi:hypothetical protein
MRSARSIALGYGEGTGAGNSPWPNRAQRNISVAPAGLSEASPTIAIATTRQTIGFGMAATALLGAKGEWPRSVLVIDFGIAAAREALVSRRVYG